MHRAVRIMSLKCDGAMAERAPRPFAAAIPVRRLGPTHNLFTVQFDGDGIVPHDDVLGEPLIVLHDVLDVVDPNVLNVIKTARLDGIAVGVVHLNFETLARETALLKLGMK